MPSRVSEKQISQAVFEAVKDGIYPEDEHVVSAEFSSVALNSLSKLLEQARADVKSSVSELSRLSASDINGWIAQAKQLRSDIDESQKHADETVSLATEGEALRNKTQDASGKIKLLKGEVAFNDSLLSTLQGIQTLKQNVDAAQEALLGARLLEAISLLKDSKSQLSNLQRRHASRAVDLISTKITGLENDVANTLTESWSSLILVDLSGPSLTVNEEIQGTTLISLDVTVEGLESLDLLKGKVLAFQKVFDQAFLVPRVQLQPDSTPCAISIDGHKISILGEQADKSIERLFSDIHAIMDFLESHLPQAVARPLSEGLIPSLVSRLLSRPLASSVPSDLSSIPSFQSTLKSVLEFANFLKSRGWRGQQDLVKWTKDAPKVWLARRSESSLHSIRQLLKRGLGNPRTVERVETRMVARKDEVFPGIVNNEDWDAGWSDGGEETKPAGRTSEEPRSTKKEDDDEGEDTNAWGFDDNEDEGEEEKIDDSSHSNTDADDGGDAWGWGDDDDKMNSPTSRKHPSPVKGKLAQSNGHRVQQPTAGTQSEQEVTLRETYTITALPEQILEIIVQTVDDAEYLSRSDLSSNPVTPAATGMFSLCGLLLSMFRASAPKFYAQDINGNMFLYNDSLYLAEQLRAFTKHHNSRLESQNIKRKLELEPDIAALELFGKRAYGREMESQRTILSDLLDGAQGFANCTEHPFAQQCDLAINSTVDRLRDIHKQWQPVLSRSAVLQSIGSLLATITNKIIIDIEDMSDISEPESQQLASFCDRIAALDDLFLPELAPDANPDDQVIPLTAGYTSTWLKFRYLSNILESSLVDIKYLWTEGELSLEFSADEVADLIEALFADSEHRRRAITEIKRGARR